jgi:hypothetical protein
MFYNIGPELIKDNNVTLPMDKLQLEEQNLGRVFNSRSGCMCA